MRLSLTHRRLYHIITNSPCTGFREMFGKRSVFRRDGIFANDSRDSPVANISPGISTFISKCVLPSYAGLQPYLFVFVASFSEKVCTLLVKYG